MSLGLKDFLSVLVKAKYRSAKAAGALTYADSRLAVVSIAGLPFQLRYCPSLAKKPNDQKNKSSGPKKKLDPFENPDPQLLIGNVPDQPSPSHTIVLNKFPIIQNHFILATASGELQQTQLLDLDDLVRTHQCLVDWEAQGSSGSAFAFFNSGEHSGASQPHRHIQLLPIEDMREGDNGREWRLLLDEILRAPVATFASYEFHIKTGLPFVHFGRPLPPHCDAKTLFQTYMDLYSATLASVRHFRSSHPDKLPLHSTDEGAQPISYNLAMTTKGMVMCARRSEGQIITRDDGSEIDYVALNGTLLGGTLMVKNEELFHLLRNDSARLGALLGAIGIPSGSGYEIFGPGDLAGDNATLKSTL